MASQTDDQSGQDPWRVQEVIDSLFGVVVIASPEGRIVSINKGPSTSRVIDPQRVIGKLAWDHPWFTVSEKDCAAMKEAVGRAAKGEEVRYDAVYLNDQGKTGIVDLSVAPLRDRTGKITHVIGFGVDVTAARRSEQQLKDQKEFAENLVETAPTIVKVVDAEGTIQHANPFLLEKTGYSLDEIVGRSWYDVFLPEEERAKVRKVIESTSPGHDVRGVINPILAKHGRKILIEWRNRALLDSEGNVTGVLSTGEDITERHRIQTELEQRQSMLADSQRLAKVGSWQIDLKTNTLSWSDEVYRIFEIDKDQFGASYEAFLDAVHPDDREMVDTAYRTSLRTRNPYSIEHRLALPDGRIKYVVERCETYYGDDGVPVQSTGTVQDITDRYLMEKELRASKLRAEEASRAKSEFLSHMSHELRTPLNAIIGFAQILQMDREVELSEKLSGHVDEISRAGAHLLELVDEILELSRVESGSVKVERQAIDFGEVLKEALSLMRPLAENRGVTVSDVDVEISGLTVQGDRTRLKQVLINLLSNAIKYSHDVGQVKVGIAKTDDGHVRASISDTGVGIPAHRQHEVFEPFNRVGAELTGVEGAGIGLTIARRLVDMMGGRIGFGSEEGVGSTFWVELEGVAANTDQTDHPAPAERASVAARRILYVEDNPTNVRLMEAIFKAMPDSQLVTAGSGEEGVELAREMLPGLILMDIGLPGIDGFEALRRLRADKTTAKIPVIAISAHILPEDIDAAREAGFEDYLTKPINVSGFLDVLRRYVSRSDAA